MPPAVPLAEIAPVLKQLYRTHTALLSPKRAVIPPAIFAVVVTVPVLEHIEITVFAPVASPRTPPTYIAVEVRLAALWQLVTKVLDTAPATAPKYVCAEEIRLFSPIFIFLISAPSAFPTNPAYFSAVAFICI